MLNYKYCREIFGNCFLDLGFLVKKVVYIYCLDIYVNVRLSIEIVFGFLVVDGVMK